MLIDCHLSKSDGTFDRFLRLLAKMGVDRLDWILLTHPDTDHFLGMKDVLDHFTSDGRSLGWWYYNGLNARDVQALIWPDEQTKKHYNKLRERVRQLAKDGSLQRARVDANSRAMSPAGYRGRVDLFPIAPSERTLSDVAEKDVSRAASSSSAELEANSLSIVLCLSASDSDSEMNALLCGDAGSHELVMALQAWGDLAKEYGRSTCLDIVKVPHHGSLDSHTSALCRAKRAGSDTLCAAISAGTRAKLPDREVIRDYISEGWNVLLTTRRIGAGIGCDRPMTLANRGTKQLFQSVSQDVFVSWHSKSGIEFGPLEAVVSSEELSLYGTARSTEDRPG
jgi:beta-lactamase superfamily II metal-dependent hydrolase